jgi:hypothetical protein
VHNQTCNGLVVLTHARALLTSSTSGTIEGLELVTPGLVPVQQWRPASELEARARSAMWGGVGPETVSTGANA